MKRTAVTQTAYYLETLVSVHCFLCMCIVHHAYLNTAQNTVLYSVYELIEFYATLAHRAGVAGNFPCVCMQVPVDSDLPELFINSQIFSLAIWQIFCLIRCTFSTFSLIKEFNIGQRTVWADFDVCD